MTQLARLKSNMDSLLAKVPRSQAEDRRLADSYRTALRLYQDAVSQQREEQEVPGENDELASLAREAFLYLGGVGGPRSVSLKDYDHERHGPFLGVSDEGSAAHAIRKAALTSPKMQVLGAAPPIVVGVAHDAERLGSIGEVPVGPHEHARIWLECTGRVLTSTNVGTRLHLRYYKRYPVVTVEGGPRDEALGRAKESLKKEFSPFLRPPAGGNPRPLTVYLEFDRESRRTFRDRIFILKELLRFVEGEGVADPAVHRLGFQMRIGYGHKGRNAALLAIDLASAAGLKDVAIDGVVRKEADEQVSLPGLLNYLEPNNVGPLLDRSAARQVRVHPRNTVDVDSIARGVWSNLNTARDMGLELGKYGTFPLTLEECDEVVGKVQGWFGDWTAAPVFFVDQATVSGARVYADDSVGEGLKEWLGLMKKHKVPVVLIDTLDKSRGWRLLRSNEDNKGILSHAQIREIDRLAAGWNIEVLWAGGISLPQVFDFGKMGVFGIYVTSAAASLAPVPADYERDPLLASLKEPSIEGVSLAKLLLEAGFLASRLAGRSEAAELEEMALTLTRMLKAKHTEGEMEKTRRKLFSRTVDAWRLHLKG